MPTTKPSDHQGHVRIGGLRQDPGERHRVIIIGGWPKAQSPPLPCLRRRLPRRRNPSPRSERGSGRVGYLADEPAALVSYLAQRLGKPILVEGPAGVGKTELAKAISRATQRPLIRLQCYEGLDEAKALYEWNYRKQLLRIQAAKRGSTADSEPSGPRGDATETPRAGTTSSARSSCSPGRFWRRSPRPSRSCC